MIDGEQLARVTAELAETSYHVLLTDLVQFRIAQLLAADAKDPYEVMKFRGGIEELQRLLLPGTLQALALRGLERQQQTDAAAMREPGARRPPRDWWSDPSDLRE